MVTFEQTLVTIAGGVALAIEANRQFSRPNEEMGHHRYTILRGVEPSSLSTPAEHRRGWFFYVACYLVIYAVFLISDSLRDLLSETQSGQKVAGATGGSFGDSAGQDLFSSGNIAMPIYLSAAIIALLSTGVASQAERLVRNVAYRLAGIPRGIYRLITRLSRIDFVEIHGDNPTALVQTFDTCIVGYSKSPLLDEVVIETRKALLAIDLLSPAVVGDYGMRFWPRENVHKLDELIEKQKVEVDALKAHLEKLDNDSEKIELFHLSVLDTRNNLQALFAILYIRNQNAFLPSDHNATSLIIRSLREASATPALSHRVWNALLLSTVFYLVGYFFIDISYQYYDQLLRAQASEEAAKSFWTVLTMQAGAATPFAIQSTIEFLVLFGVAAGICVMVREKHIETGTWNDWRFGQLPMQRFLLAAFWPVFWAGFALICWRFGLTFATVAWYSWGLPTEQQIAAIVREMFPYYFFPFLYALVISLFVFIAADKHDSLAWWKTILIAVVMALIYSALVALAVFSTYGFQNFVASGIQATDDLEQQLLRARAVREVLFQALPSFLFFISLAGLLELSEIVDD